MNNLEKKLTEYSGEIREAYLLKKEERVRILENILAHTSGKTLQSISHIPSPYQKVRFPHFFFMNYTSITLLFVFVFTGVLSYVADGSLPGDPLYSVKTQVNENIQTLLTVSPESKAKLQTSLAKKRVEEAEELVAADRLSLGSGKVLAINFNKHLTDFQQFVDEVIVSESSFGTTSPLNNISLASIDATSSQRIVAYNSLKDISVAIHSLSNVSVFSSSTPLVVIATSTASSTVEVATTSTSTVKVVQASFHIENSIVNVQSIVNDAIDLFKQEDYVGAQEKFVEALKEIKELQEVIKTTPIVFLINSGNLTASTTATTTLVVATSTIQ